MMLKVFSVYDKAAGAFLQPFFAPTSGLAIRSVADAVSDTAHQFNRHAGDYTLFILGEFNDADGSFSRMVEPEKIITCTELLAPKA